jgi:adenylate cyclase
VSGLVLLLFSAMHLVNLAFGLHSIDALDAASQYLMKPWSTLPATLVLLAAALVHMCVGLLSIAQRRSLVISRTDWVQMTLGVLIIPLLLSHLLIVGVLRQISPQF